MHSVPELASTARRMVVETSAKTGSPHLSSSLSCVDILASLKFHGASSDIDRREIYLSKGHAALGLYAVLVTAGQIPPSALDDYCEDGSIYEGHVNSKIHGIPLSTGSLGHALPFAVGRAIGESVGSLELIHWVVLSDGELDEGSNWEGLLIASHNRLSKLNIIVDRNGLQSLASTEETSALEPLGAKLEAFGWKVIHSPGHNHAALGEAIASAEKFAGPCAIIAETTKGYGVKDVENNPVLFHYKPATSQHVRDISNSGFEGR
jgi:transketolase